MRATGGRFCSACTSMRRTGRGRHPATRRNRSACAAPACATIDGGTQQTYARMVQAMDRQVGRVLQALDANGLSGNTVVVFTSDNGGERFSDTWPFTGVKTELLEGGLRVPALVCWPDRVPAGRASDQVMITMDWLPTLLDAAGTAPDAAHPPDGISLLPVLTGQHACGTAHPVLALQDQRTAGGARRRLQVSQDPRQQVSVRRGGRSARARQPQAPPQRCVPTGWSRRGWTGTRTMLPEIPDSFGEVFTATELADHIGAD